MKINNHANLSYKEIGEIIDNIIEMNLGDTIYFGKVETTKITFGDGRKIKLQIRYLKRYVEWTFVAEGDDEYVKR